MDLSFTPVDLILLIGGLSLAPIISTHRAVFSIFLAITGINMLHSSLT